MDNLPIPQSRIEELMNAFISRDSSQISTPQSRIEEFWYHLIEGTNALPIPQSRIELLLKKIIENDTKQIPLAKSRAEEFLVSILTGDINKLPIPQSRSEYYLDYIARNNLVLDDIEYVKYSGTNITASNTVQKPFRSAILKGQTLVNYANGYVIGMYLLSGVLGKYSYSIATTPKNLTYKKYTIIQPSKKANGIAFTIPNIKEQKINAITNGVFLLDLTNETEDLANQDLKLSVFDSNGSASMSINEDMFMIIEGDYTNQDIPYFEGMQSVKMPVLTTSNEDGTKSNILTVNEDVTLRGIGDVRDTLDCLNGEVTERIGEVVLDGSENIRAWGNYGFYVLGNTTSGSLSISMNNKYQSYANASVLSKATGNGIAVNSNNLYIKTNEFTSVTEFTDYLQSNPITVQYQLATESIKTVDLKVVDQDGNPVKQLSAFDSTTHIISDSESDNSLIAIAEVEVPTKLIEALNAVKSLSSDVEMLINEVDNAQKLQDENSTMVMSAMTELYEMVLVMGGGS